MARYTGSKMARKNEIVRLGGVLGGVFIIKNGSYSRGIMPVFSRKLAKIGVIIGAFYPEISQILRILTPVID